LQIVDLLNPEDLAANLAQLCGCTVEKVVGNMRIKRGVRWWQWLAMQDIPRDDLHVRRLVGSPLVSQVNVPGNPTTKEVKEQ
jgi:hypothetical protein